MGEVTEFSFEVLFRNLDLSDDDVLTALAQAGAVAADSHDEQTVRVAASVSAPNAVRAATAFITDIQNALPKAEPVMVARDLVNITDIAERAGVTREAVRNWAVGKRRAGQFPTALGALGGQKVWEWAPVNAWLRLNLGIWDGLSYPNHGELGEIDAFIEEYTKTHETSVRAVSNRWRLVEPVNPGTVMARPDRACPKPIDAWRRAIAQ
jgi:hypothetical protein